MKRNNNSRNFGHKGFEVFDLSDTRYYGVFLKGQGKDKRALIDPKRYEKYFALTEEMKAVINKRKGPFFQPAKKRHLDYNINYMSKALSEIRQRWEHTYKSIISRVISEILGKSYTPYDDNLAMSGILEPDEAAVNANMKTLISHQRAEDERTTLYYSLYAQFFQQMASQIEALFIKVLTKNGYEGDKFNRNILYAFKGSKEESVKSLAGFVEYDRMYAIWNFLKHNSLSTYNALKSIFPQSLQEAEYSQGELACFYVKFDDGLIDGILAGVDRFAKGYCRLVFGEDEQEARWNSEEYFLSTVNDAIEGCENPLGLPWWI
jgi:hypothetical protein